MGYRYSLDPFLLADFTEVRCGDRVADLGTGSAILPLLLAQNTLVDEVVGVELQPQLIEQARQVVRKRGLEERIALVEGDVRCVDTLLPPQSFSVVVSNPPYRSAGRGRLSPDTERASSRHELAGGLDDFLEAAFYLLKQGGRFYVVFLAERLAELLAAMRAQRLEPKRLRCVHSRLGQGAKIVLVEGRCLGKPGVMIDPPLFTHEGDGLSSELRRVYDSWSSLMRDC
ncbi:MAG: SAM-dependent methyltransferase [Desulfuromonas sp.]|nr:MAG: SAM-dependent methyltransferase [Desulfuromonas sp.]